MTSLQRHPIKSLVPWLLLGLLLLGAAPARAQITCTASMTALNFGNVDPLSSQTSNAASLTYNCSNGFWSFGTRSAQLCFSITEPSGTGNPRQMNNGANTLQFQLYHNANNTSIWGSQFSGSPTPVTTQITLGWLASTGNVTIPLYGLVLGGQTGAVPGLYQQSYGSGNAIVTVNDVSGGTAPSSCSTTPAGSFPFTVSASVIKHCTVAAGISPINLGTVAPTATNVAGNTSISVTCSNTTPYYIGLLPSNSNSAGAGVMSGTGGNASTVPYQLYQNAGLTTIWGNTATASSAGNGVSGTGTGVAQSIPVYAKAPTADFQPDIYTDTVVVNVNY